MRCLVLFLLLSISVALRAQDRPPTLLLDAAHCLATETQDWLGLAHDRPAKLELGYVENTKSYPGQDLLYIVDYTDPLHSQGLAFAVAAAGNDPHRVFTVLYSVRFHQAIDGTGRVDLINPSVGGIWTQEQLVAAISHVALDQTFQIPVADLLSRPASIRCEAGPGAP